MQKQIRELMKISLSDGDLQRIYPGKIQRICELKRSDTIESLLRDNICYLLYELKPHSGHWCLLLKTVDDRGKSIIEFFDPYSGEMDSQLQYIDKKFAKESGQDQKLLTRMLIKCKYPVHYNEFEFQRFARDINDCGRWCAMRGLMHELPLREFNILFQKKYSKTAGFNPDEIVTFLTDILFQKNSNKNIYI